MVLTLTRAVSEIFASIHQNGSMPRKWKRSSGNWLGRVIAVRIYNKFRAGTENLQITALINDRSWGVKLETEEILEMATVYLKKLHPGKTIDILNISTKG